jgi:hypothetical protein
MPGCSFSSKFWPKMINKPSITGRSTAFSPPDFHSGSRKQIHAMNEVDTALEAGSFARARDAATDTVKVAFHEKSAVRT